MQKISIIVNKSMSSGQKANVAAIIMGQLSINIPSLYGDKVEDISRINHAGISVNIVVLDGGSEQLLSLIDTAKNNDDIVCCVFSSTGQSLSNSYPEYQKNISTMDTRSTGIIGVGLVGDDTVLKPLTKKFSLVK